MRNIKLLHPDAKIPIKKHPSDAGWDCFTIEDLTLPPYSSTKFPLGLAVDIKPGELLTIRSRSSTKIQGCSCTQTTCDAGYTGQLHGFLINHTSKTVTFAKGSRVVQLVFIKLSDHHELKEGELDTTTSKRGDNGFGSTGGWFNRILK